MIPDGVRLLLFGMLLGTGTAAATAQMPVRVGGGEGDACGGVGHVSGLRVRGFLAVRGGPGTRFRMIDRLGVGHVLRICEERADWYGVVYDETDGSGCGVASSRPARVTYAGPCRSGWVHARHVALAAG